MVKKKVMIGLLSAAVLCTSAGIGYKQIFANNVKKNVTLLSYSAAKVAKTDATFKINALSCGEAVEWLSDNEVLTLNKKSEYSNPNIPGIKYPVYYLSVYNINTGKTKDFKDVNDAGDPIKISPDKKYVLYTEPKVMPQVGNTEWQNDLNSGKLFSRSVKILNLTNGKITDFKGEYKAKEANYSWIDNNKLFVYYPNEGNKWNVENVDGTIYKTGNVKAPVAGSHPWPASNLNIKVSGNDVSGNFIVEVDDPSATGEDMKSTYYSVNVATNEMKQIYRTVGTAVGYTLENNVLLIDDWNKTDDFTRLVYFNDEGVKLGEAKTTEFNRNSAVGPVYDISKDGKTIAFPAIIPLPKGTPIKDVIKDTTTSLDILDLSTGKMKKVYQSKNLIKDIRWSQDGTSLIFNDGKQYILKIQ
ncbi:hypothetical protein ACJDT4_08460 [Clostridium neuense]|uniref:Uncharacterized protein n=1 Tax=Clostridium neuense TaxID=1728934 RepID=A0ABW8TES3_9CLOT